MAFDVCAFGPITKESEVFHGIYREFIGGPPYFFSVALKRLGNTVMVVTKISEKDAHLLKELRELSIKVVIRRSLHTSSFHTDYGKSLDERHLKVLAIAEPFELNDLKVYEDSKYVYIGPLTTEDFTLEFIKEARTKAPVILDVQGFTRKVSGDKIMYVDWSWKLEGSKYIDVFKADLKEAKLITGSSDPIEALDIILSWGPREVIITSTNGVYLRVKGVSKVFFAPFIVKEVRGRVGRGDTCLAAYLHARLGGMSFSDSIKFAAATASLKLRYQGPLRDNKDDIIKFMRAKYENIKH